jgi:isoamylase
MATTPERLRDAAVASHRARLTVSKGEPHPLGATPDATGVNFALFSQHATGVTLLLFDAHDDIHPVAEIRLDPRTHKSFHFWHCHVGGIGAGTHYAYRVDGPWDPSGPGHRFDAHKVVIDPYAKAVSTTLWNRGDATGHGDNLATSMRSAVVDLDAYDWEGDQPLNRPMAETVIYEMHVGGFTKSPTSGVANPGTFLGIIEKIPYLKSLGVTAVELLPVCHFDPMEFTKPSPIDGSLLYNYWGYSTVGFFTPHPGYCASPEEAAHIREFRDMVKALHKAGIEVILDMVFNHTSEGNDQGPTISYKGIDNSNYYYLTSPDRQYYMDYTGCGNTFNCNHPIADKLIVDSLEFWVRDMHVDGFRFDEGSVLTRGEDGAPMAYPPVVWNIELSEVLANAKIIAEAWDAAGLYQIGYFPGYRWAEWNGMYRDAMRRFVRGDAGVIGQVASRMSGSSDIYSHSGHLPINSVNFINCHDGFTLRDLVSYNQKHNFANGEDNRDGNDDNMSWNCGVEGETDDAAVEAMRLRQMKNFATLLMLSRGVPMFLMGDEIGRTQQGNNNTYCQDNHLNWMNWEQAEANTDLKRFFAEMIAFRLRHDAVHEPRFFSGEVNRRGVKDIEWHGCELGCPGWDDPACRSLAFTLAGFEHDDEDIHVMLNMDDQALSFALPAISGRSWVRAIDTALPSPDDIAIEGNEVAIAGDRYVVNPRSVVVLLAR